MPHQVLSNPVGSTGVTYRWHTVQPGETFASLAKAHYGSASLRAALWRVNRHLVSEPDDLLPGTMILIPPPEVLDRLVESSTIQAIEQDDDRGGRVSAPVQSTRRKMRLFQRP
jgi:hypothetical protein